jgi:hypothetical protein
VACPGPASEALDADADQEYHVIAKKKEHQVEQLEQIFHCHADSVTGWKILEHHSGAFISQLFQSVYCVRTNEPANCIPRGPIIELEAWNRSV